MNLQKCWEVGELNESGGYDCMTAGVRVGNALLDGRIYGQGSCDELTPEIEAAMMEDARLIAAAPDLLEALSFVMVDGEGDGYICREAMAQVRYAIAKATRGKA